MYNVDLKIMLIDLALKELTCTNNGWYHPDGHFCDYNSGVLSLSLVTPYGNIELDEHWLR